MKKNLSILFIFSILLSYINTTYAEEKKGYDLYKYRVESICKPYKPEKIIINSPEYEELSTTEIKTAGATPETPNVNRLGSFEGNSLEKAKKQYRDNMNDIYKCSILDIQSKSYKLIKTDLTNNNAELKKDIEDKISNSLRKIEISKTKLKCSNSDQKKDAIQKQRVLQQTSYELCKYNSYLEYIREHNKVLSNLLSEDESLLEDYNLEFIANLERKKMAEIDQEIEHAYKVYPIAFQAYSEYENNLAIHLLLELLKEDFMAFRESLHKSINPLNQVIYKISNAMKK